MPDGTASRQGGTIPTARWSSFSVQLVLMERYIQSSVNASKVLKTSNIDVCKSSICELLKKNAIHCG